MFPCSLCGKECRSFGALQAHQHAAHARTSIDRLLHNEATSCNHAKDAFFLQKYRLKVR